MKSRTCCFSGHRSVPSAEIPKLEQKLDETLAALVSQGVVYFGSGGAIGWDSIAARAVLRLREHNPAVKLIMVLPCKNQDAKWSEADRTEYKRILDAANKVVCLAERYYDGCMAVRNKHLVEHSGTCVAYMKHATHLKAGNHLYHIHELAMALERAGGVPTPTEPEIVHGYMITDIHSLGHKSIVLAHNPNAVSPYVTWQQTKGREGYDHGHYYAHRRDAEKDFLLRADAERTGADYTPYMPPQKNRDDAR